MGEGIGSGNALEFRPPKKEKISVSLICIHDMFHYLSYRKRTVCSDNLSP